MRPAAGVRRSGELASSRTRPLTKSAAAAGSRQDATSRHDGGEPRAKEGRDARSSCPPFTAAFILIVHTVERPSALRNANLMNW